MLLTKLFRQPLPVLAPIIGVVTAGANSITGPSSSQSPYVIRAQPGVVTVSLLTVGDAVNFKPDGVTPYRMVGIPDGLGAFDNGDGTFTVLMNHELPGNGVVREHGFRGAFVSRWVIDKESLEVLHGQDLTKRGFRWDVASSSFQPITNGFSRLCSADLPALSAFYNADSGLGYNGRIFMNGEESGAEGRGFAHLLDGNSFELPWLGKFSWENSVTHPDTDDRTVVIGLDDTAGGQLYIYVGQKTGSSHPIEAAGLKDGSLYGLKINGFPTEPAATGIPSGTSFSLTNFGNVSTLSGLLLETISAFAGVTAFQRPEDGSWDPSNPNDFYFVTTASFNGNSRLWRLRFNNPADPAAGGTIAMLLNGSEGVKMMDNMTVAKRGKVILQEDVGGNVHLGKIWSYSIKTGSLEMIAQHDPARFTDPLLPTFLTIDEEASGVIPLDDILGEGWLLMDVQAHYRTDAELVEGGQLLLMHVPPGRQK